MGKPTAAESSQLNRMADIAKKLRNGSASDADRDEAQAIILEVYVAERMMGLVSVGECELLRKTYTTWNAAKAWTIIGSILTICLTVAGTVLAAVH